MTKLCVTGYAAPISRDGSQERRHLAKTESDGNPIIFGVAVNLVTEYRRTRSQGELRSSDLARHGEAAEQEHVGHRVGRERAHGREVVHPHADVPAPRQDPGLRTDLRDKWHPEHSESCEKQFQRVA